VTRKINRKTNKYNSLKPCVTGISRHVALSSFIGWNAVPEPFGSGKETAMYN